MEVRYTVTLEDYIAFTRDTRGNLLNRTGCLFVYLGFSFLIAAYAVWLLLLGETLSACSLGATALCLLLMSRVNSRVAIAKGARAAVRRTGGRGIIGEHTLIFSEEALVAINEVGHTVLWWRNLTGVDVVSDRTYVWFCGVFRILPRAGFDRAADYESARDFALRKWAEQGEQ